MEKITIDTIKKLIEEQKKINKKKDTSSLFPKGWKNDDKDKQIYC